MKIKYYDDTDTLYIELSQPSADTETRQLDDDTFIEMTGGRLAGITIDHAKERTDFSDLMISGFVAASQMPVGHWLSL